MSQIIAAVQEKGGVGKSMILCALAAHMAGDGIAAVIVDTDPQETCMNWGRAEATTIDVIACLDDETLPGTIEALEQTYPVILIDTAGYKSAMAVYAVQMADLVLIPMQPSLPDVRGAINVWRHAVNAARAARREIAVRVILNQVNPAARITREIEQALKDVDIPLVGAALPQLTGFREMITHGGPPRGLARRAFSKLVAALQIAGDFQCYQQSDQDMSCQGKEETTHA